MEKINKNDIVTALSISSSRASSCIAVLDKEASPTIVGLGKSEGKLLGGKGVLDIDVLSRAIRDSLERAQQEANLKSPKAFVSISGGSVQYEKARGMVRLSHRGEEISNKNIKDALKTAEIIPLNVAREIIHSVPQNFIVDGQKNIKNPVGLYGVKLEVETLLITSHLPFLQNIIKSLSLAGVELEDIIFSGIATSKSLLSQATEGKGIILLEIDNNFTSASFFFDNVLNGIDIQEESVISDGVLKSLKENVDKIRGEKPISKILLAGGGYIHEDFIEKVDSIFGIPSETAYLKGLKGTARDMNNPAHLTSAGLALYGLERRREDSIYKRVGSRLLNKVTKRVGNFLNEYF